MKITSLLLISVSTIVITAMPNVLHATDTQVPRDPLAVQNGSGQPSKPLTEAAPSSANTTDKTVLAPVQSSLWNLYGLLSPAPKAVIDEEEEKKKKEEETKKKVAAEVEKKAAEEKAEAEKKKADAKAAVDKVVETTGLPRNAIEALLKAGINPLENIGTSSPKVAAIVEGKIGTSYESFLDGLVAAFEGVVLDVITIQKQTLAALDAKFVDKAPTMTLQMLKGQNPKGLDIPLDKGEEAIGKALAALEDAVTKERTRVSKTSAKEATERNLTMLIDDVSFCVMYAYSTFEQMIEKINKLLALQNDITREKSGGKDAEAARLKAEVDYKKEGENLGSMLALFRNTVRKPQMGMIGSIRGVLGWSSTRALNVVVLNKALNPRVVNHASGLMTSAKLQAVRTGEEQKGFAALLQNLRDSEVELKVGSEVEVKQTASKAPEKNPAPDSASASAIVSESSSSLNSSASSASMGSTDSVSVGALQGGDSSQSVSAVMSDRVPVVVSGGGDSSASLSSTASNTVSAQPQSKPLDDKAEVDVKQQVDASSSSAPSKPLDSASASASASSSSTSTDPSKGRQSDKSKTGKAKAPDGSQKKNKKGSGSSSSNSPTEG